MRPSRKKVKKLKHLVVNKNIYYKILNTSYIFTYSAWNYCKCNQFHGCRLVPRIKLENRDRSYGFVCHFSVDYHSDNIENLKKIADIFNNYTELKNDIQLCIDFDPLYENFWLYHYKTSW